GVTACSRVFSSVVSRSSASSRTDCGISKLVVLSSIHSFDKSIGRLGDAQARPLRTGLNDAGPVAIPAAPVGDPRVRDQVRRPAADYGSKGAIAWLISPAMRPGTRHTRST